MIEKIIKLQFRNGATDAEMKIVTDSTVAFIQNENIDELNDVYEEPNFPELIRDWSGAKGILSTSDSKAQTVKLMEEIGELARAILKQDKATIVDSIGDAFVVLTNIAALEGLNIENCIADAWNEIKNRTGEMQNGTFVKQSDLKTTSEIY